MAETNETSGGTMISDPGEAAPPPVERTPSGAVRGDLIGEAQRRDSLGRFVPPTSGAVRGDLIGEVLLGRYQVIKKLGEGGMGTVYLAEHMTIRKKFAVKVLSHEFAHKADLVERFLQEARAASMISQENVVEITDFGDTPDGSVFFVMEFLRGEDLSDTVRNQGALGWARVKPIILQVCRALEAAHEAGIVHRDMKPENCYRTRRGKNDDFIKVLDFGIAKVTTEEGEGGKGLTRTGMIFGTPEYMSPEQAQGARIDLRVDVYAVGIIMYELLTGRVPFMADTFMGILTKHMFEVPEAPSRIAPQAGIPAEAESIILKALQKDREFRFQDMPAMMEAIEAVGTGAAGVEVVQENIVLPATGEMSYTGGYPTVSSGDTGSPRSTTGLDQPGETTGSFKRGLLVAVAGTLGLGALGFAAWTRLSGGDDPVVSSATTEHDNSAAVLPAPLPAVAAPDVLEVVPQTVDASSADRGTEAAAMVVPSQSAPLITIHIQTEGVNATILDAEDMAIYGTTNTEVGIDLERSSEALSLILRAEGYEDLAFSLKPNRPKKFEKRLKKVRKKKTRPGNRNRTGNKPANRPSPPTEEKRSTATNSTPQSNASNSRKPRLPRSGEQPSRSSGGGVNSPDLKDPFAKRGTK